MIQLDLPRPQRTVDKPLSRRAAFSGAQHTRLVSDWHAMIMSADAEMRASLRTLRGRSRQLCRDNSHAAGMINALKDNVLGAGGIGINPRMRLPRGKLMKESNLAAWQGFVAWGDRETCSADGQNSWPEFQRLALATWAIDGEAFVRRIPGFDNAFGYTLQIVDADLVDDRYNGFAPNGNQIVQSIEIDAYGRAMAYWIWERHPLDVRGPGKRLRIAASEILHLFLQLRPNQRRGLPMLTPVLIAMKMLDGYSEAEITAARLAAAKGGFFVKTGDDVINAPEEMSEEEAAEAFLEVDAEPGERTKLPPGWRYEEVDPAHPNGNFAEFHKLMVRVISCALPMSYITFSHDLSDTTYGSGRIGLIAERDAYRSIQQWFGDRLVVPVYRDVLRFGSMAGQLVLPSPEVSKWCDCQLEPRGWQWIDPKADVLVANSEVGSLFNSPQRICAALGRDFADIVEECAEAKDMVLAAGLDWPTYGAPQGGAPTTPDPAEPVPTKGSPSTARSLDSGHVLVRRVKDRMAATL